jgi:ubiquinone/menaquinone biosynthesis C-methylase UbiE
LRRFFKRGISTKIQKERKIAVKQVDVRRVTHKKAFLGGVSSRVRETAAAMCESVGGVILDVGCGNGLLFAVMEGDRTIRIGVDRSMPLLKEGREVLKDNEITDVHLVRGDGFRLPLKQMCAERVLLLNTLLNIPTTCEVERLLHEAMIVCRPGGRLIVEIRNEENPYLRLKYWLHSLRHTFPTRAYRLSTIRTFLEAHGLRIVRVKALGIPLRMAAFSYVIEAERL